MPDLPLARQDPHRHGNLVTLAFLARPDRKVGKQNDITRNILSFNIWTCSNAMEVNSDQICTFCIISHFVFHGI